MWVSSAGQDIQHLLVCDDSHIWPFQHGILQWQPPILQQIRQLRIKDGGQNVSISPELLFQNCKAAPAVGLTAGSRHSSLSPR